MARLAPSTLEARINDSFHESLRAKESALDCDLCRQAVPLFLLRQTGPVPIRADVDREALMLREEYMRREPLDPCPVEVIGYKLA